MSTRPPRLPPSRGREGTSRRVTAEGKRRGRYRDVIAGIATAVRTEEGRGAAGGAGGRRESGLSTGTRARSPPRASSLPSRVHPRGRYLSADVALLLPVKRTPSAGHRRPQHRTVRMHNKSCQPLGQMDGESSCECTVPRPVPVSREP